MAGPFGITQVDAPGLLEMYSQRQRQSLEDQYRRAQFERQAKKDTREDEDYERANRARAAIARGAKPEEVIAEDPTLGFDYAKHSAGLDEAKRKAQAQRAEDIGNAALIVQRAPAAEQPALWDAMIDRLVAKGYGELAEAKGRYDAKALPGYIAESEKAVAQYLDATHQDRTFGETQRHNRTTEGTAAAGVRLRERAENRQERWGKPAGIIIGGGAIPTDNSDLEY